MTHTRVTDARLPRTTGPAGSLRDAPGRRLALVTAVVVGAVLLVPLLIEPNVYDEGFALVNAVRIGQGQVPYRDFWTVYSPGEYYVVAALFWAFGKQMLVARLADTVLQALVCWQVHALVRTRTGPWAAAGLTLLSALFVGAYAERLYPVLTSLLLSLVALRLLLVAVRPDGRSIHFVAVGLLAGLAGWFRQDDGVYALVMVVAVLLAASVTAHPAADGSARGPGLVRRLGGVGLGVACALAALFAPWAVRVPFSTLVDQLVVHPTSVLPKARHVPLPGLLPDLDAGQRPLDQLFAGTYWLTFPFIVLVVVVAVVALVRRRAEVRSPERTTREGWLLLLGVAVLGLAHLAQVVGRYDFPHALPSMVLALVLLALSGPAAAPRLPVRVVVGVVLAGLALLPAVQLGRDLHRAPPWRCASSLPDAECIAVSADQQAAVRLVRSRTSPGDPLFVGTSRHDMVMYNDALFYYLADRDPATRYHEYSPLVTDTEPVQREMVAELTASRPPWIVLLDVPESTEPNASSRSSGVVLLDEWIRAHYDLDTTIGTYQVWRRRS